MARFREGVFRIGPPQRSQRPRRLERWHFFVCTHAALASLCVDRSFVERTADAPRQRISFVASNTPADGLSSPAIRTTATVAGVVVMARRRALLLCAGKQA
jgi:hypothetical protein